MHSMIRWLARMLAMGAATTAAVLLYRPPWAWPLPLMAAKLMAGAVAAYAALVGALLTLLGLRFRLPGVVLAAGAAAVVLGRYVRDVTAPRDPFRPAFGCDWEERIPSNVAMGMLPRRWTWWLSIPRRARWERDVAFATIPDTGRRLLSDVWQPPEGTAQSGLALIYLHGGYWHYLDKDLGTRPLFRHLADQGHVVMDVAYRLCPEVGLREMMGDVQLAIRWMKDQAGRYGVNPERIVVAGSSAGAHLALLAAYAPGHPRLTPEGAGSADLSVRAVVSYYGPPDLRPADGWDRAVGGGDSPSRTLEWLNPAGLADAVSAVLAESAVGREAHDQRMANLLGGTYEQVPEMYAVASPITHIWPGCPPTLIFQGAHDSLVPVDTVRALHRKLVQAGAQVVYVEFPKTEHGFDLMLPRMSAPAQASLYYLDRFLALMAQ